MNETQRRVVTDLSRLIRNCRVRPHTVKETQQIAVISKIQLRDSGPPEVDLTPLTTRPQGTSGHTLFFVEVTSYNEPVEVWQLRLPNKLNDAVYQRERLCIDVLHRVLYSFLVTGEPYHDLLHNDLYSHTTAVRTVGKTAFEVFQAPQPAQGVGGHGVTSSVSPWFSSSPSFAGAMSNRISYHWSLQDVLELDMVYLADWRSRIQNKLSPSLMSHPASVGSQQNSNPTRWFHEPLTTASGSATKFTLPPPMSATMLTKNPLRPLIDIPESPVRAKLPKAATVGIIEDPEDANDEEEPQSGAELRERHLLKLLQMAENAAITHEEVDALDMLTRLKEQFDVDE